MPWRPKAPSPTWRSFLHNHMHCLAAIDMFVVVTATFRLLYALVVLGHDRRKVIHFEVTENPTQDWLARQMTEAFPWETAPRYLLRDRDASYGQDFRDRVEAMGIEEVVTERHRQSSSATGFQIELSFEQGQRSSKASPSCRTNSLRRCSTEPRLLRSFPHGNDEVSARLTPRELGGAPCPAGD
jgi:hypothetical protein